MSLLDFRIPDEHKHGHKRVENDTRKRKKKEKETKSEKTKFTQTQIGWKLFESLIRVCGTEKSGKKGEASGHTQLNK